MGGNPGAPSGYGLRPLVALTVKRSPLKRGTSRLRRKAGVRKANAERRAERFERAYSSIARAKWVNMQTCVVCGAWPSQAAHVTSRAAGGTADDLVSLCAPHHRLQHDMGIETFQAHYGVDLAAAAARQAERWRAHEGDA